MTIFAGRKAMPIKVNCPSCGMLVQAPDEAAGKMGRCPKCNSKFAIPAAAPGQEAYLEPEILPPAAQAGPYSAAPYPSTSGKAIASLVLGLLSLLFCLLTGIPAIILGALAISSINRSRGELTGKGMAVAGICLGGVSVLFIPIIAAIAIPSLLSAKLAANEATTVGSLKTIATQQAVFKQSGQVDQNENGNGEYGLLGELCGELAMRPATTRIASPPFISQQFRTGGNMGNGTAQKSGYFFKIYLSNATAADPTLTGSDRELGGSATMGGPKASDEAIKLQEQSFVIYAWPADLHNTGERAFVVTEWAQVYTTRMEARKYSGADGPSADAAFVGPVFGNKISSAGTPGNDGNVWIPVGG
jgi:hypothetical protein